MNFSNDINQCLAVLKNGGIILYPTDTVWGIGCDATNEAAVEKIIQLKQRPQEKSFVVLVADEREILQYAASPDLEIFNFLEQQTKPTTVVYENALGLAENILAKDGSVAMRICNDEFCKHLIKRFQKPIVSTSANISGEPTPQLFSTINSILITGVDYVVNHKQNETEPAQASQIIKWENGEVVYLRK